MKYSIPYGKTYQEINIPDNYKSQLIQSNINQLNNLTNKTGSEIVKEAMNNPINSKPLKDLSKTAKTCTIIISDHTRPVPSKDILPHMLAELRQGNPKIDITLLVATGFHRASTKNEMIAKLGEEVFNNEKIVIHNCRDKNCNIELDTLPSGAPLVIDKLAAETDLLVAEGFIEPHFFAGFSGGRKSVLPGVCDQVTVLANHNGQFIDSKYSRTGILEHNPIHEDMIKAAEIANLQYIVNVIINEDHNTVAAFAGNFKDAHLKGCDFLSKYAAVDNQKFDIVITGNGGAPLDQNIYQSIKSMTAAEAIINPGGIIIECSECEDGHGGLSLYEHMRDCKSVKILESNAVNTPFKNTEPDQ